MCECWPTLFELQLRAFKNTGLNATFTESFVPLGRPNTNMLAVGPEVFTFRYAAHTDCNALDGFVHVARFSVQFCLMERPQQSVVNLYVGFVPVDCSSNARHAVVPPICLVAPYGHTLQLSQPWRRLSRRPHLGFRLVRGTGPLLRAADRDLPHLAD